MKMHNLSKKTLAIFLSLTMLMSCMVWSGVSAATTYTCNFTNYGITGTSDIDKAHNSIATVVDTGEADYGYAMRLEYLTDATGGKAGFRFFGNTTGGSDVTSSNGKVQYNSGTAMGYFYVEFEYKVLSVAGDVDLQVACGSIGWTGDNFNAVGGQEVIETLTGATEWKTARAVVNSNPTQNSAVHIFLQATDPATAAGTQVLVDNVRVIKDYVAPAAVLDYGYDSKTETLNGLEGNAIPFPTPVRDGYVFQGWYDAAEGGNRVTEATFGAVGSTTTYYAQWKESETKSSIRFVTNGGAAIDMIEGEAGVAATLPTPVRPTYVFSGWYEDEGLTQATDGLYPAVGEVKTLYAKWTAINYTAFECDFDTQPVKSDNSTASGYKTYEEGGSPSGDSGDNRVTSTLWAKYYYNQTAEGEEPGSYMELYNNGASDYLAIFRLFGNAGDWQRTINGTAVLGGSDLSRGVNGLTYRIFFKYKVLQADGAATIGIGNKDGTLSTNNLWTDNKTSLGCTLEIPQGGVTADWQTYTGVFTNTSGGNYAFVIGLESEGAAKVLIDDIVMEWMPDERYTNLTFDNNDETGVTSTSKQVAGDALVVPEIGFTRPGYNFVGWYTAEDEVLTTVPAIDTTLTAKWVEDATVTTVSFVTNGVNEQASIYGKAGTAATLPTPTNYAYVFAGWYTDETLETKATNVTFPAEGVTTLYAKWDLPLNSSAYIHPSGLIGTMDFETGEAADYMCQTSSTGKMEISEAQAHTGEKSFLHVFKSGDNAQRGRPRIALTLGDATKQDALQVKAGESYTVSFWIRADRQLKEFTFYAATIGASDFGTMINASSGACHTLQTLDYYAVGSDQINASFSGKEPTYRVLQPEQWTRVVMHIPSIVLDDANDVNYLTIGYTASEFTPGKNAPDCNIYIDDVAVYGDMEVKGELVASDSFEDVALSDYVYRNNYTPAIDTTVAHSGSASLSHTISDIANAQRIRPRVVLKNGAENFVVEAGKSYTVSFWVRSSVDSGAFTFYLATMGTTDVATQISAASGSCHTLQTLSYASVGTPKLGADTSQWGASNEVGSIALTANRWTQVIATIPAAVLDEEGVDNYLALGYTYSYGGNESMTYATKMLYIDDIEIYDGNITDGDEMLDNITSAYQYVAGGDQDGNVVGETAPGSAIYVQNGVEKTAFRVAAKYTAGDAINKVIINGQSYEIVERGMLLGYANTLNGAELTLETTKDGGLAGKASTVTPTNYWDENSGTNRVTYTILVRGVTKELKDVEFVSRAYMIILVNGKETVVYSDMSATFSAQSIYNASGSTATWFS